MLKMEYFEEKNSVGYTLLGNDTNNSLSRENKTTKVAYRCLITLFIIIVSSGIMYSIIHHSTANNSNSSRRVTVNSNIPSVRNSSHLKVLDNYTLTSLSFHELMKKTNLTKIKMNQANSEHLDEGCTCRGYGCECCVTLTVPEIHLNDTGCLNFTLLPSELGISLILMIDRYEIINQIVSPQDALCITPPYMEKILHFCIYFNDLDITSKNFHGCVELKMKIFYILRLKEWSLGCFNLSLLNLTQEKMLKKLLETSGTNTTSSFSTVRPTKG